jgi:hypothetical protein
LVTKVDTGGEHIAHANLHIEFPINVLG